MTQPAEAAPVNENKIIAVNVIESGVHKPFIADKTLREGAGQTSWIEGVKAVLAGEQDCVRWPVGDENEPVWIGAYFKERLGVLSGYLGVQHDPEDSSRCRPSVVSFVAYPNPASVHVATGMGFGAWPAGLVDYPVNAAILLAWAWMQGIDGTTANR